MTEFGYGVFPELGTPFGRSETDTMRKPSIWVFDIRDTQMAMVQNQWYHFGIGAPPILVYFSPDWDVHRGYGVLTHGHISANDPATRNLTLAAWPKAETAGRKPLAFG